MSSIAFTPPSVWRGALLLAIGFGLYSAIVISLSATGAFARMDTNIFAGTVVAATVGLSLAYFYVPSIRLLANKLGPYGLSSFHVWRIPAALTFLYYGSQGWLPDIFVTLAGWGDMLAGVLAAIILILPRALKTVTGFHVIEFADFAVAVGTGVTLNAIAPESMANIVLLPVSLIPLIGVPLSGATHIAALHQIFVSGAKVGAHNLSSGRETIAEGR